VLLAAAWWPRRVLPPVVGMLVILSFVTRLGEPVLEIRMIDVGQGDAILLRDGRRGVLIDGGGWPRGDIAARVLAPAIAAAGLQRLDAVVLTHPDRDHCAGLESLARRITWDEIWMGPGWLGEPCAEALLRRAPRWRPLWRGRRAAVGRWRFEVLHPAPGERLERNDRSLVIVAEAAGHRLLLTGDVEAAGERRMLQRDRQRLAAGILKVAHHGSKTSTTERFLRAVQPRLALISAGRRNPYGHPSHEVTARLRSEGVWVLRSDELGQVRIRLSAGRPPRVELPAVPRATR
jgi:competence protein ComEC